MPTTRLWPAGVGMDCTWAARRLRRWFGPQEAVSDESIRRGDDHDQAVSILGSAMPEGPRMKNDLARLLSVKDKVHYQAILVSKSETESALRQAKRLLAAAESTVAR